MCAICNNVICPSQCPSAKEGTKKRPAFYDGFGKRSEVYEPVSHCNACGTSLFPGDTALIFEDYVLCEDCLDEATVVLTPEGDSRDY